jgi:hypothetical protein
MEDQKIEYPKMQASGGIKLHARLTSRLHRPQLAAVSS